MANTSKRKVDCFDREYYNADVELVDVTDSLRAQDAAMRKHGCGEELPELQSDRRYYLPKAFVEHQ